MTFRFAICHRTASMRKLYSVTLTYIFDFRYLRYLTLVRFHILTEAKIVKMEHFTFNHLRSNAVNSGFLLRVNWPTFCISIFLNMWHSFLFVCCQKMSHAYEHLRSKAKVTFFFPVTLTYILKVKRMKICICETVRANAKTCWRYL